MHIKPAIRLTEIKPMPISRYGEGYVMIWGYFNSKALYPKAKRTLSECIVSWIHEITVL